MEIENITKAATFKSFKSCKKKHNYFFCDCASLVI